MEVVVLDALNRVLDQPRKGFFLWKPEGEGVGRRFAGASIVIEETKGADVHRLGRQTDGVVERHRAEGLEEDRLFEIAKGGVNLDRACAETLDDRSGRYRGIDDTKSPRGCRARGCRGPSSVSFRKVGRRHNVDTKKGVGREDTGCDLNHPVLIAAKGRCACREYVLDTPCKPDQKRRED